MSPTASANSIIRSIPTAILTQLGVQLQEVTLKRNAILHEVGDKITHLYFPLKGVVSIFTLVERADAVESGVIGREGVVGTILLANVPAFTRAQVQIAGTAVRMRSETFLKLYELSAPFRKAVLQFNAAFIAQIQQNVACNILHDAKQRMCRWLLHATDRMDSSRLALTQETLGVSIGAHRTTIIAAISSLEDDGIILHSRGKIEVLDRRRLIVGACECYRQVQSRYIDVFSHGSLS